MSSKYGTACTLPSSPNVPPRYFSRPGKGRGRGRGGEHREVELATFQSGTVLAEMNLESPRPLAFECPPHLAPVPSSTNPPTHQRTPTLAHPNSRTPTLAHPNIRTPTLAKPNTRTPTLAHPNTQMQPDATRTQILANAFAHPPVRTMPV